MRLENVVFDCLDPQRLGGFWQAALSSEPLTDEPDLFETRLRIEGGPTLDLCFQPVPEAAADARTAPPRLHLELTGGADRAEQAGLVRRLLDLGAQPLDDGRHADVASTVLADPEGNPCCVREQRALTHAGTGALAMLPLDCDDPDRDAVFWAWLTGWVPVVDDEHSLRHPSARGVVLALCPAPTPKGAAKNRLHLDVRLEAGEDPDDVETEILRRGGRRLHPGWGELAWRCYTDPSGNEFCVLPASSAAAS